MLVWAEEESVRLARSQDVLSLLRALGLPEMSFLYFLLNSCKRQVCQLPPSYFSLK